MFDEMIKSLKESGWSVFENEEWHLGIWPIAHPVKTNSIYLFEKTYLQADNANVVISIHPYEESFVVIDSAEHRTSGPNVTVEGVVKTLEAALVLAQSNSLYWDERLDNQSNNQR